jgi:hypothetical protein
MFSKITKCCNIAALLTGLFLIVGGIKSMSRNSAEVSAESEAKIIAKVASVDVKLAPVIEALQKSAKKSSSTLQSSIRLILSLGIGLCVISALNLVSSSGQTKQVS